MSNKTASAAVVLILLASYGIYSRSHRVSLPPETEIPQILKEAAGTAPIPQSDTPTRKALRDSFKSLLDETKSYQTEANRHYVSGHLNGLLQANSFLRSGEPQAIIAELKELKELDQRHLTAVQHMPDVFAQNLTAAGASASEVAAFDRGMRGQMSSATDQLAQAMNLDMQWIDAVVDLYKYVDENQSHMAPSGAANVQFDSEEMRLRFVELSEKADQLSEQRDKANQAVAGQQERSRQKMGITSADISAGK